MISTPDGDIQFDTRLEMYSWLLDRMIGNARNSEGDDFDKVAHIAAVIEDSKAPHEDIIALLAVAIHRLSGGHQMETRIFTKDLEPIDCVACSELATDFRVGDGRTVEPVCKAHKR